jgi:nucleoside-diphosphate-sugar epimerase
LNILITGANGFIGMALCDKLLTDGHQVRGAVRSVVQMTALPSGVEGVMVGDIGPETDWSEALDGIEGIVHLAARVHVMRESVADPLAAFRLVNVAGTARLARQAAEAGVKRMVYLSSVKVNGEGGSNPYTEMDKPEPQDAYAVSKWEAEQVLAEISSATGMETVIIRPPLVYGPNVRANFLRLLRWVNKGLPLPLGMVDNRRSLVSLDNLVDFLITCIEHPTAAGETFLVSDGEDLSTPALIRRIALSMNIPARLIPVPVCLLRLGGSLLGKKSEVDRLCRSLEVNISKAKSVLGWKPPLSVDEGLAKTTDWCLNDETTF